MGRDLAQLTESMIYCWSYLASKGYKPGLHGYVYPNQKSYASLSGHAYLLFLILNENDKQQPAFSREISILLDSDSLKNVHRSSK